MGVPRVYRGGGEGAVASYDGYDFASGIGRKNFYGAMFASGALINDTIYSDKIDTVVSGITTTGHKGTLLFTKEFQMPSIIYGTAFVDVPMGVYAQGAGTLEFQASCAIIKQDGKTAAETVLGTGATSKLIQNVAGVS